MERAQKAQRDAESGQHGLFGVFAQEAVRREQRQLPTFRTGTNRRGWRRRKKFLGFFITGHPLEKYKEKLADLNALSIEEVAAMKKSTGKDETITTAG